MPRKAATITRWSQRGAVISGSRYRRSRTAPRQEDICAGQTNLNPTVFQASLRDAGVSVPGNPWTEVHGYHQIIATRQAVGPDFDASALETTLRGWLRQSPSCKFEKRPNWSGALFPETAF